MSGPLRRRSRGHSVDDDGTTVDVAAIDAMSDPHDLDHLLLDVPPTGNAVPQHDDSSETLEIRIDGTVVHRSPNAVSSPLRYTLAGIEVPKRLGVTSSIHGEGATSMSRSLAALIAHDWRATVCWIDVNWWKSGPIADERHLFHSTIADVVDGLATAAALPVATSIPGLSMVAAGETAAAGRSRLPRSERLRRVVDELAASFDYVVLDLPPVLATADALALGRYTDGYLLVVRQRAASTNQVRAALRTMNTVPCMGTIMNVARSNVPRWLRSSNEAWAFDERP